MFEIFCETTVVSCETTVVSLDLYHFKEKHDETTVVSCETTVVSGKQHQSNIDFYIKNVGVLGKRHVLLSGLPRHFWVPKII